MTKSDTIKEIKHIIKYLKKKSSRGGDDENLKDKSSSQLKKILKSYQKAYKISKKQSKKSKRSKHSKRSKRSKRSGECSKQSLKKYKSRSSPPYPANKCCNKTKKGNDDKMYVSKKLGSSCKWVIKSKKSKTKRSKTKRSKKI